MLGDGRLADLSAILFCCNPASVFYSAAYSEAPFAGLTLLGLTLLPASRWAAVAALAAAAATRSNGVLACGYLVHGALARWRAERRLRPGEAAQVALGCLAICLPSIAHQARAYFAHCRGPEVSSAGWLGLAAVPAAGQQPQ